MKTSNEIGSNSVKENNLKYLNSPFKKIKKLIF